MIRCAICNKLVKKLGDMHECVGGELRFCVGVENNISGAAQAPAAFSTAFTNLPLKVEAWKPKRQRGGAFQVNGFIALALLAVAVGSAVYGYYQHSHRVIELHITLPTTQVHRPPVDTDKDAYITHIFPEHQGEVCHFGDNICWIRI